ncbi:MAG: YajD family HNH nuclease [bacterium]
MPSRDDSDPKRGSSEALGIQRERLKTYRERALRLFPWICGHCGREFSGKRLRELTVHHKDHNHDHNPPDGSYWELLGLYCHDNEHSRYKVAEASGDGPPDQPSKPDLVHSPFAGLGDLLKGKLPE